MKIKISLAMIVLAALCGSSNASPQPAGNDDHSRDRDEWSRNHLGKLERASKIIGMEIKDAQDERLGKVKDLAIDLQNGRIVEVIVGRGGVLGVDEQYVAIPPGQFTSDLEKKTLQLNIDKEKFKSAPAFKMSDWESNIHQTSVAEVYHYYGDKPYFTSEAQSVHAANPSANHLGEVQRATKLMGTVARNQQNDRLGKVENLVVDLPAGRVVEVILASGGFLGLGDELSAVPPQSFHPGVERDTLTLDTTKEALASAPHFKSSEWPNMNDPEHVKSVYKAYNVEPYFAATAADNTAQNVRERADGALTPLSQGASKADVETSRQIRQQIIAAEGLSVNARNVKVITVDGHVTLRGPVNSEDEKRQIAEIAAKVTSPANVDNQLQVANTATPNPEKP